MGSSAGLNRAVELVVGAKPKRRKRSRITLQLPADLVDQVRDAAYWLSGPPNQLTISAIAERALAAELDRIRQQHNGGAAFRRRVGQLRIGRPIGS